MDVTTLDEAKELLYGYPVASFVAERDVLVKAIRGAGDRELANLIKALRKPSAIAALVNQVVRDDPAGVELILQASALLRSAQAGALEGSGVNASQLQEQYRAAVGALAQSAPDRRAEVRSALEAATIDEASNQDLRNGCLVVVPAPQAIFGTSDLSHDETTSTATPASEVAEPIDELQARRARRQAQKVHEEAIAAKDATQAAAEEKAERAKAAAEKKAAAEAERERKAAEKERKRQLKELQKQHRNALRAHLTVLDEHAAAVQVAEQADQQLVDIDTDIAATQETLTTLRDRRSEIVGQQDELAHDVSLAHERALEASDLVQGLANRLAELEANGEG